MRNMVRQLGGISMLAMACSSSGAWAQSAEDWAAIQAEIAELKSEVKALRAELDAQGGTIAETQQQAQVANERAVAAEAQFAGLQASAPQPTDGKPGAEIQWKGAPNIVSEDGWSFKPRGRLQFDFAQVGSPDGLSDKRLGFSNELRRARLGVQGTMPGGFGYKAEFDFADNDVALAEGFVNYADGGLVVTAGQHNNFQSLAEMTSSNDVSFMERAAFTDAFDFQYRVGLSAQYLTSQTLFQAGVFTANVDDLTGSNNDTVGVSGRVVYMPKIGDSQLHLAASAHYRDLGDSDLTLRYRQRPMVHTTDIRFIDTRDATAAGRDGNGDFFADSETNYGLEAALLSGRFHAAAETHWQHVARPGFANPTFFGGYGEIGYFLTDNKRGYKAGVFKAPKMANGVDDGGMGAVQLVARFDHLDLSDAGIEGGSQDGYEVGINWWPIEYVRLMLNYGHLEYDNASLTAGGNGDYSTDVVAGRVQLSF